MWAIQPTTFFNMLLNTNTQQLGNIFLKLTAVLTYWMRAILLFCGSVRANWIVYYWKCFTSDRQTDSLTDWLCPSIYLKISHFVNNSKLIIVITLDISRCLILPRKEFLMITRGNWMKKDSFQQINCHQRTSNDGYVNGKQWNPHLLWWFFYFIYSSMSINLTTYLQYIKQYTSWFCVP